MDGDPGSRFGHAALFGVDIESAMDRYAGILRNCLGTRGCGTDNGRDDKHRNRSSKLDNLHCRVSLCLDLPGFRLVVDNRCKIGRRGPYGTVTPTIDGTGNRLIRA